MLISTFDALSFAVLRAGLGGIFEVSDVPMSLSSQKILGRLSSKLILNKLFLFSMVNHISIAKSVHLAGRVTIFALKKKVLLLQMPLTYSYVR